MDPFEAYLKHHGVKGMKWGVRKSEGSTSKSPSMASGKNWTISNDGSIHIKKGGEIQRVVRNHKGLFGGTGEAFGVSSGAMYAAFTPKDKAEYEHHFGRSKSLLVKDASMVLKFKVTKDLRSPSPKEAADIYVDLLRHNPELRAIAKKNMGPFADVDKVIDKPSTQKSIDLTTVGYDSGNYNPKLKPINDAYHEAVKAKGYNMIMDLSDGAGGFQAPVVILEGRKHLELSSQSIVDKASQEKVRRTVKDLNQINRGIEVLDKLGYM